MLWIPWPRVPRTRLARPPIPACCQALRPPDLLNCRTRRVPRALRQPELKLDGSPAARPEDQSDKASEPRVDAGDGEGSEEESESCFGQVRLGRPCEPARGDRA